MISIKNNELSGCLIVILNNIISEMSELAQQQKPSTLLTNYSLIKSNLQSNNNVDISKYLKLITYLKQNGIDHKAKKGDILQHKKSRLLCRIVQGTCHSCNAHLIIVLSI